MSGCSSEDQYQKTIEQWHSLWSGCYDEVNQIFLLDDEISLHSQIQKALFSCRDNQSQMKSLHFYDDVLLEEQGNKFLDYEIEFLNFLGERESIFLKMLQPLESLSEQELSDNTFVFTQFVSRFLQYEEDIEHSYHDVLELQGQFLKKYDISFS